MARKRHHSSQRKQSMRSRFHEHSGEERHLHGFHLSPKAREEEMMMREHASMPHSSHSHHRAMMHRKYDTLRHEPDAFNDEYRRDSMPEKSGPYKYDRMVDTGKYDGYRGRRHQEMMDAGMIHEDQREIANLPQGVMIKPYPHTGPYLPEDLDDTIRGVDRQMNFDDEQKMKHFFPKKV